MRNLLAILILFTIVSCQNGEDRTEENNSKIAFEKLSFFYDSVKVTSKYLQKNDRGIIDTPMAKISFPVFKNSTLNEYVKRQVFDYFAKEEKITSYQDIAMSFINGYDDFVSSNKDTRQIWSLTITIDSVAQLSSTYLSLKYIHFDYTGGAHGNKSISYLNYNPKTNTPVTLDSLIEQGKMATLVNLAEGIFRKNEKLSPTAPLEGRYFFDKGKFALAQTFHVSEKGLIFTYNPYEIKPYSEGYTELIIPFKVLKDIAKPNSILTTHL